jgi:hypothetical protein
MGKKVIFRCPSCDRYWVLGKWQTINELREFFKGWAYVRAIEEKKVIFSDIVCANCCRHERLEGC